jgi:hypothetical protein
LKMTTFKIVFTFDGFFSAETTMHCKVTCILYKKQAHFSRLFCLQIRSLPANNLRRISTMYVRGYLQGSENGRVVTIYLVDGQSHEILKPAISGFYKF